MGEMHEKADAELLRDFAERADETAFCELVTRYTDLVYSAAVRQVNSPDLARDVAQNVFTALAGKAKEVAAKSSSEASLAGWLFRSTRFAALNQLRDDRRRLARERQVMDQLDSTPESEEHWERIRPILDEAMADLNEADRDALLLRFFKNRDFRAIGAELGVSDDTAQKRVSRALEKLRSEFARRGVTTTAAGLAAVLAANAVTAAPVGFAAAFSTAALAGAATLSTSAALTTVNTIAMTTLQKVVVSATLAAAIGAGLYQTKQVSTLRQEVRALQQQQEPLTRQIAALEQQRSDSSNLIAALSAENSAIKKSPSDLLKLRGEVGRLQEEKASISRTAALSKVTETPEARNFLREQQKVGMGQMYGKLAKDLGLAPEAREALNDLLADNVMENVDLITTVLRDKTSPADAERLFAELEADLTSKVQSLLKPEEFKEYQEYTRELTSLLIAEQFKGMLSGDDAERNAKKERLLQVAQAELRAALAKNGLPDDYQAVPILNFRNIAFEGEAEKSLKLLDDILGNIRGRGGDFLSEAELLKFDDFRKKAAENNRMVLGMNRAMMAPIGK